MDKKSNLITKIENLRDEITEKIDGNLHNMTIDELVNKSNELNKLIVEYHRLINSNID